MTRRRSSPPVTAVTLVVAVVAALGLLSAANPAEATVSTPTADPDIGAPTESAPEPVNDPAVVPCEVAMVIGCVATIDGPNGTSSVTLELAKSAGQLGEPAETSADDESETDGDEARADAPPLRSGLDPWERGGLRANFGTDAIPISQYQIGADVTGLFGVPDPVDTFVASQTNWAFTTSTFLVILSTNALDWAFEFPLAEELIGDAGVLAQNYSVDFFGFGLSTSVYSLALTVTMIVAGFKAVTKGVVAAGAEVGLGFVAYVILIVLTVTSGFGDAGLSVARVSSDLSSGIASFAAGQERQEECTGIINPITSESAEARAAASDGPDGAATAVGTSADGQSTACSFGFAIQRSLVELPYQNLQWGQVLDGVDGKEECAAINLALVREGPWGNADEPRERMRAVPACEENADFNHQASYIRLGIASANTLAAAAVTILILSVSAMLLWQQIKLLFLTVTMPHALVFAILPGRSRRLAWTWVEHLVGVVIRTVVLALGLVVWLSLFSLIVHEQLTARGIFLSLFASVAMAISGFFVIYRLGSMTRRINPAAGRRDRGGTVTVVDGGAGRSAGVTGYKVAAGARATARTVRRRHSTTGSGTTNGRGGVIGPAPAHNGPGAPARSGVPVGSGRGTGRL